MKRSLTEVLGDVHNANSSTRYVELVLVNDHKVFVDSNRSEKLILEKSKQIANIVNALYNQLNVYVVFVGIVIWTEKNEITLTSDGNTTLTKFLHYRRDRISIFEMTTMFN